MPCYSLLDISEHFFSASPFSYLLLSPCPPGRPGPPGVVVVEEIGDKSVKLTWSKGADHHSPILYYTVQTRDFWALDFEDWRTASTCRSTSLPTEGALTLTLTQSKGFTVHLLTWKTVTLYLI